MAVFITLLSSVTPSPSHPNIRLGTLLLLSLYWAPCCYSVGIRLLRLYGIEIYNFFLKHSSVLRYLNKRHYYQELHVLDLEQCDQP